MATLCAWLSAASCVKSRRAVLSMTPRLTWPSSLDDGAMSRLGEQCLAEERLYDGGWFLAPPLQSGGAAETSGAVQAQALSLAGRAPAGGQRPHSRCHAGPASGAGPRRPVRCGGTLWSGWFWGVCAALRSRREPLRGRAPAMGRANFSRRPIPDRCPLAGHRPGRCRWLVVGGVRARSPWGTP